jgi:hypothetical protein
VRELLADAIAVGEVHDLGLFEEMEQLRCAAAIVPVAFQPFDDFALLPQVLTALLDMAFGLLQMLQHVLSRPAVDSGDGAFG